MKDLHDIVKMREDIKKLYLAAQKKSCRSNFMVIGHLDVPVQIIVATALLSRMNVIRIFVHRWPHVAAVSTIRNSSFH